MKEINLNLIDKTGRPLGIITINIVYLIKEE